MSIRAPVGDHDVEQRRRDDVIEQDEPAGDKADVRVDAALHVTRSRRWKARRHAHVAERREADGNEADDVDERRHAHGLLADQAPNGLRRDDDHEQHTVEHDVFQAELAVEFLL